MKWWAQTKKSQQAFTIVELLVVLAVIAILAVLLIVGYGIVQNGAHDTSVRADLAKFGETVQLKILDDDVVPPGGATSSLTGDSTLLPGIVVIPNEDSYDGSVANLYYCAGEIDGVDEFAFVTRSASGKALYYSSTNGVGELTAPLTWTATNDGVATCTAMGFLAPFTWSYGYNPDPAYLWFDWAEPS
jgi:prepilin-type N-terminal cleavage/methylation domain-containing protein